MNSNDVIRDARVEHVRELKAEIARLKAELSSANDELRALRAHFDLALLAAADAAAVPSGGRIVVVDGCNLLFNVFHRDRAALLAAAAKIDAGFVWVVFDGPVENVSVEGRMRVSYTGGTGTQRADRLVTDYIRMLRLAGVRCEVVLVTGDREFGKAAEKEGATCLDRF